MSHGTLPLGKLPADFLAEILADAPASDQQLLLGPGPGIDCAVLDLGNKLLVLKSDPVTFTADNLGWYLVQINANDIATCGARPRWLMVTLLFPEAKTTEQLVRAVFKQLYDACESSNITLIGGHTEISHAIDRPIAVGTLIGEVSRDRLVTPRGATPGDSLLLTKFIPIEAVAIMAREFRPQLEDLLDDEEFSEVQGYLQELGISVLRDAQVACSAGQVHAMHDPTEGGLASALWELADACGHRLVVDLNDIPISDLARQICAALKIDPLAAISSGALLLAVPEDDRASTCAALQSHGIACTKIGRVEQGPPSVWHSTMKKLQLLDRPARDEIARLFDER
jgi:hydrogenase expression/formation protein HypE